VCRIAPSTNDQPGKIKLISMGFVGRDFFNSPLQFSFKGLNFVA